jgi:hypothetical protein
MFTEIANLVLLFTTDLFYLQLVMAHLSCTLQSGFNIRINTLRIWIKIYDIRVSSLTVYALMISFDT